MQPAPQQAPRASALLTDLYQLTMAQGYWKAGKAEQEAVFHLFFRENPFGGGYTLTAGLTDVVQYLREWHFTDSDLDYLTVVPGRDGRPLFDSDFLEHLGLVRFTADVDAMPEGTIAFPHQPLLRVQGPILQAQLVETALLNIINFQSLIATKAARICLAAEGDPVIEFGLRRAQGVDGGLTASRAAYIGGCSSTSNVLAGQRFGIPVKGTHAHSWIMSFRDELEAFHAYAEANPNNCIFLVDTYDSLEGVRRAVAAGHRLRKLGHELGGIRLDSGDLARLSLAARKILDAGGFADAVIVASNDLDEHLIADLKQQGAVINVWGVGTKLVTAYDQPALGGVYKLSALRTSSGGWDSKLKLSEQPAKSTYPGILQVRRFRDNNAFVVDALFDTRSPTPDRFVIVDPLHPTGGQPVPPNTAYEDLLVPVLRDGQPVSELPGLEGVRDRVQRQLASLDREVQRLTHPQPYRTGLEQSLHTQRRELVRRVQTGTPSVADHESPDSRRSSE
jgi:nicotinate phosphoribosyltransferase